ncbi:MAG TPA: hypothetical protein VI670_18435 [Thermoanaerobaculia bacterium]
MKNVSRFLVLFAFAVTADAQVVIKLDNSFINDFANRATITANYMVVHAHPRPNPGSKDGDLHVAGTAKEIGLAAVAEIMNAKDEKPAMDAIHAVEGKGETIEVTGAWRLWAEHAGGTDQIQTDDTAGIIKHIRNTNPDHVFQIHPITSVNAIDVRKGFHPTAGFKPKDAEQAFTQYENLRCRIMPGSDQTTIMTNMAGFNYVKFRMDLVEDPTPFAAGDGTFAYASVSTLDDELLIRRRRMIFLAGTPPEKAVKKMKTGDHMIVLGIPRIDLALVKFRRDNAANRPEVLDWNLPYEIVVVGVFAQ